MVSPTPNPTETKRVFKPILPDGYELSEGSNFRSMLLCSDGIFREFGIATKSPPRKQTITKTLRPIRSEAIKVKVFHREPKHPKEEKFQGPPLTRKEKLVFELMEQESAEAICMPILHGSALAQTHKMFVALTYV